MLAFRQKPKIKETNFSKITEAVNGKSEIEPKFILSFRAGISTSQQSQRNSLYTLPSLPLSIYLSFLPSYFLLFLPFLFSSSFPCLFFFKKIFIYSLSPIYSENFHSWTPTADVSLNSSSLQCSLFSFLFYKLLSQTLTCLCCQTVSIIQECWKIRLSPFKGERSSLKWKWPSLGCSTEGRAMYFWMRGLSCLFAL